MKSILYALTLAGALLGAATFAVTLAEPQAATAAQVAPTAPVASAAKTIPATPLVPAQSVAPAVTTTPRGHNYCPNNLGTRSGHGHSARDY